MRDLKNRLQEMTDKLKDKSILKANGLGNEVNFHIFDYDPIDEYKIIDYLEFLNNQMGDDIIIFDIYDLIIEILKEEEVFDECFEYEEENGTKALNDIISSALGIGTNRNLLNEKIQSQVKLNQVVILKGMGKCYGIVRAHVVLYNLQEVITDNPVIMMYPGIYDGQGLRLFNKLTSDNYYRAFQFVGRK